MPKNVVQKFVSSVMVGSPVGIWTLLSMAYFSHCCHVQAVVRVNVQYIRALFHQQPHVYFFKI